MGEHYASDDQFSMIRYVRARAVDFMFQGRGVEAKALLSDALTLARNTKNLEWEFHSLWGLLGITDLSQNERTQLVNEYHSRPRAGVTARNLSTALWNMTAAHLADGDRRKADELASELDELARQTRQSRALDESRNTRSLLAALDGRFEETYPAGFGLAWATWGPAIANWRGIALEQPTSGEGNIVDRILSAWSQAELCDPGAIGLMELVKETLPVDFASQAHIAFVSLLLEAAIHVQERELCEHLYVALQKRDLGTPISNFVTRPHQRVMGDAAVFLGRPEEARRYYEEALATCGKIGHRPERAIVQARMAELLLEHFPGEREAAIAHLENAISEFKTMGMQPALKRAYALRERVAGTPVRPAFPDGLSAREVEVLRLVAAGRSNARIAEELVISLNTVQHHVSNILSKTGSKSRTGAAAYAHRHGLL
jgi:DNA-binding CsgD family transcriptional regulator